MLLIILFPPKCYFSYPLMASKMNVSGSCGPEGGGTLGSPGCGVVCVFFLAPHRKELLLAA